MRRNVGLAIAVMCFAGAMSARADDCLIGVVCLGSNPPPVSAPEIDPSSAMAGLSLLAGGLAVLRGRRGKKLEE